MSSAVLAAQFRQQAGKEAAQRLRKIGRMPAVFYGPGAETLPLSVNQQELERILKEASTENIISSSGSSATGRTSAGRRS